MRFSAVVALAAGLGLAGCRGRAAPPGASADPDAGRVPATQKPAYTGPIRFEEVAAARGITWRWPRQPRPMRNIEAFGCGCAFLDYDNDGWMDILLVARPHVLLYHNRGDGTFEDVTTTAGLDKVSGYWTGCAVGDYDGDGKQDILLTGYRRLALLRNVDGKRFVDVTRAAGLDPANRGHWGSSAGFMDLDGSGRLALIVLNYVIFGPREPQYCELHEGVRSGCPPSKYRPEYPELWQNAGEGRFKEITRQAGLGPQNMHGKALVVAFADIRDDGRMDFYIGNDGEPAELMGNMGGLKFYNFGQKTGAAYSATGHAIAAMGADWADYDRDGHLDLVVTAFSDESYSLLRNLGNGLFEHTEDVAGIAGPTLKPLGFGAKWIDMDNDGWPDIVFANGHVYDNVEQIDALSTFRQPLMLFHNEPGPHGRQFVDLVPQMGGDVARPLLGRGSATGDLDNDGRTDFLVVDLEGAPVLMHNLSQTPNHWITFDLRSDGPNHFAYGAKVTARSGKEIWVAHVSPASSYLSSSDPRVHFGLGSVASLDTVTIHWPDGANEVLKNVAGDRIVHVTQGRGMAETTRP